MTSANKVAADPEVLRLTREVESLRVELQAMGRRLAEAERMADHDVLTPLLNRRAFVREPQRAIGLTLGVRQIGAVDSAEQALSEADAAMYLRKPNKG